MKGTKKITDGIYWIGGSDRRLERFENIFPIPEGVSYNSYFVDDEKTAVFDTADITIADQYIENLKESLAGKKLDYLVVLHMEPDHCSCIDKVVALFPAIIKLKIVFLISHIFKIMRIGAYNHLFIFK